jgi:hypothetical protein
VVEKVHPACPYIVGTGVFLYDVEKIFRYIAGMRCKKLSGIGIFTVCKLLRYGIAIPESGESGTAGNGFVRQCQVVWWGGLRLKKTTAKKL